MPPPIRPGRQTDHLSFRWSEIFLHPGDFHFGSAPRRIGTLLGSCVSITVWHPALLVGGMCHILLPGRHRPHAAPLDGRYADEALEMFALELKVRRIEPETCQARLFGGGNMFAGTPAAVMNVGRRNIAAARRALDRHGFVLASEHVGGTYHRRLHFDLSNGHVCLAQPDRPSSRVIEGA